MIHADMSNEDYHAHDSLSASGCKKILRSMAHYLAPQDTTPAMELGTAIHTCVLEPDKFEALYIVKPDGLDMRYKEGKAWAAENEGKTILYRNQWDTCFGIRDAVHRHSIAKGLLTGGVAEQSVIVHDAEHGVDLRCRPDYITRGILVDLKSAVTSQPADFGRAVINFGYDVQEAFYRRVWHIETGEAPKGFVFVAVEKNPPYAVSVLMLDDDFYDRGHRLMMSALRDYAKWVADGKPDVVQAYPEIIHQLSPPVWAMRED